MSRISFFPSPAAYAALSSGHAQEPPTHVTAPRMTMLRMPPLPPSTTSNVSNTAPALPVEIENKYLVRSLPANLHRFDQNEIEQGYIIVGEGVAGRPGTNVRLRRKGDSYVQTVKSGPLEARTEVEVELTKEQFDALWPLTEGRRVQKTRYKIPCGEHVIELDVYHGALDGLFTAEVEFASEAKRSAFVPPAWFGKDVTRDGRYKNAAMAVHGAPR